MREGRRLVGRLTALRVGLSPAMRVDLIGPGLPVAAPPPLPLLHPGPRRDKAPHDLSCEASRSCSYSVPPASS